MFAKGRETPSVVSTRVLRTHRLNEVETFRLQGKIRTIDHEIHNNYSQISDEIDGVRKNLKRIKKLKNNLGISVERRKILRDRGVFVIPSPGFQDEGITLRRTDGKKVLIRGKECYDGEVIRKCLDINFDLSELKIEEFEKEEESCNLSAKEECFDKNKNFKYRIISPPLRPGSRRNFKSVEDDEQSEESALRDNYMDSLRPMTPARIRVQTALSKRENKHRIRSRSQSGTLGKSNKSKTPDGSAFEHGESVGKFDGASQKHDELSQDPALEKMSVKNPTSLKKIEDEITADANTRKDGVLKLQFKSQIEELNDDNSTQIFASNDIKTTKQLVPKRCSSSANPTTLEPTKMVNNLLSSEEQSVQRRTNVRRNSICFCPEKNPAKSQIIQSLQPAQMKLLQERESIDDCVKFQPDSKDITLRVETYSGNNTKDYNKGPRINAQVGIKSECRNNPNEEKSHDEHGKKRQRIRIDSFNSIASAHAHKANRKLDRRLSTSTCDELIYDARPGKALSKGYTTMQMTIGGKQVRLCLPKFSNDEVVERARTKSAAKLADDRTRSSRVSK